MIISIDAEKPFDKIQYLFMIKLHKVVIEGTCLDIIMAMYDKSTANIIINCENLKGFPLRSGTTKLCTVSPLINILLEVLAMAEKKKRKKEGKN